MKKYLIKLGNLVAILLMFAPLGVIIQYEKLKTQDFYFFLICSILYSIYFYSILIKQNKMKEEKEHYYKFVKDIDKKMKMELSDKEKLKVTEEYLEDIIKKYF